MTTCKTTGCSLPASGKSKYCPEHKKAARAAWKANVAAAAEERATRYATFAAAFAEAEQAGIAAGEAHEPTPMVVAQHKNMLDDSSPIEKAWYVPQGVCGFAWINIRPGNSSAAIYAKKHHGATKAYYGGMSIWVHRFGQSYERKMAYARAYAKVLQEQLGIQAYAGGRLD